MGTNQSCQLRRILVIVVFATVGLAEEAMAAQVSGQSPNHQDAAANDIAPDEIASELEYVLPDACRVCAFEIQPTLEHPDFARLQEDEVAGWLISMGRVVLVGQLENVERVAFVDLRPQDQFSAAGGRDYWIIRANESIDDESYFAGNLLEGIGLLIPVDRRLNASPKQLQNHRYWVKGSTPSAFGVRGVHFVDERTAIVAELDLLLELIPQFHRDKAPTENTLAARLSSADLHGTYTDVVACDLARDYINRLQFAHLPQGVRRLVELAAGAQTLHWQFNINADESTPFASALCEFANEADAEEFATGLKTHREEAVRWLLKQYTRADSVNPTVDQFIRNIILQASVTQHGATVTIRSTQEKTLRPSLTDAITSLRKR